MFRTSTFATLAACCSMAAAAPDIVCGTLDDTLFYGTLGGISAYSVGTTACNSGTELLEWVQYTSDHPVIQVSIFRLHDGRMEQLGVSFVKHSFQSLQGNACGFGCLPGGDDDHLGVGCSDPYGAGYNGGQSGLGPRSEINAWTGDFQYPFTSSGHSGNAIYKRIQVQESDMQAVGALYFVEGQYAINDEYDFVNDVPYLNTEGVPTSYNNVTYKRLNVFGSGAIATTSSSYREKSALIAWKEHGLGPNSPDPDVTVVTIAVPNEGKLEVASKATDLGNGTWRYDYAVHNQNSHLSVGSFSVPSTDTTTSHYFHDVDYHDSVDALIDGADWNPIESTNSISWATAPYDTNVNANAIRWGTTYNFSFVSPAAPTQGDVTVGMWRDAGISLAASVTVPTVVVCAADLTGDSELNFFDISAFLAAFSAGEEAADFTDDGEFNFFDISAFLKAFSAGCP